MDYLSFLVLPYRVRKGFLENAEAYFKLIEKKSKGK